MFAISALIILSMILVRILALDVLRIGTTMYPLNLVSLNVGVVLSMIRLQTNVDALLIDLTLMAPLASRVMPHNIGMIPKKLVWEDAKTSHSSTRLPNNAKNAQQEASLT